MYRNSRPLPPKIDPKTVPSSRHCIFIRGLPYSVGIDNVRGFFDSEVGSKCRVEFFKTSEDRKHLFLALRFETHEMAKEVLEKFNNKRILDNVVQIAWFKDMRRARDERQYSGYNPRGYQGGGGGGGSGGNYMNSSSRSRDGNFGSGGFNNSGNSGGGGGGGGGYPRHGGSGGGRGNSGGWRGSSGRMGDDRGSQRDRYSNDYYSSGHRGGNSSGAGQVPDRHSSGRRRVCGVSDSETPVGNSTSPDHIGAGSAQANHRSFSRSRSRSRSSYTSYSSRSRTRSYSRSNRGNRSPDRIGSRDSEPPQLGEHANSGGNTTQGVAGHNSALNSPDRASSNHNPHVEAGELEDSQDTPEPMAYRDRRSGRRRAFTNHNGVTGQSDSKSHSKRMPRRLAASPVHSINSSPSRSSSSSQRRGGRISPHNHMNNEEPGFEPQVNNSDHMFKRLNQVHSEISTKRYKPEEQLDNNLETSNTASNANPPNSVVMPVETLQDKIKKRKSEIELAYKKDCETFSTVAKLLLSKDTELEERVLVILKDVLRELGQQCIQDLRLYIDKVIDKTTD